MTFYNTINETGATARESTARTSAQEREILALFRRIREPLTPWDVERELRRTWPITSIRRAISDLTAAGVLRKTATMRPGPWGKPSHTWELTPVQPVQGRLL